MDACAGPDPLRKRISRRCWVSSPGLRMSKKEKMASILRLVGGKPENVERIVDEIDKFFDNLNAELEDWKISMEEFGDGTRIFARFQILVKK